MHVAERRNGDTLPEGGAGGVENGLHVGFLVVITMHTWCYTPFTQLIGRSYRIPKIGHYNYVGYTWIAFHAEAIGQVFFLEDLVIDRKSVV